MMIVSLLIQIPNFRDRFICLATMIIILLLIQVPKFRLQVLKMVRNGNSQSRWFPSQSTSVIKMLNPRSR